MGWFWAETATAAPVRHSSQPASASPPPTCPMHKSGAPTTLPSRAGKGASEGSCPIQHPSSSAPPPRHASSSSTLSKLNPLNYMPSDLSQARDARQTVNLPTDRELSSIPRGDVESNWEYPSPQQMYNAMLRKGHDDTPQDAVESMVAIHNFLNEGAWAEIVGWEQRFSRGLGKGWSYCREGEEAFETLARMDEPVRQPKLLRFQGRPKEMTPKAKMMQALGQVYPAKFKGEPPFDRHDWFVQRQLPEGQTQEMRYVIDYYSAPPEPTGEPVFYLDVRPAIDGPTAAVERLMRWGGDVWYRASGAEARKMDA